MLYRNVLDAERAKQQTRGMRTLLTEIDLPSDKCPVRSVFPFLRLFIRARAYLFVCFGLVVAKNHFSSSGPAASISAKCLTCIARPERATGRVQWQTEGRIRMPLFQTAGLPGFPKSGTPSGSFPSVGGIRRSQRARFAAAPRRRREIARARIIAKSEPRTPAGEEKSRSSSSHVSGRRGGGSRGEERAPSPPPQSCARFVMQHNGVICRQGSPESTLADSSSRGSSQVA